MASWAAARACAMLVMAVLVLRLHRVMVAKLLEATVVLGMMRVFERLEVVDNGVCGRRHGRHTQSDGKAENISHDWSPDSVVLKGDAAAAIVRLCVV